MLVDMAGGEAVDPGPLTLVLGDEELLVERAVAAAVAAARRTDPSADVTELSLAALAPGELAMATSPSLFGGTSVLVVRDAHDAGKDAARELVGVCEAGLDNVVLVVTHAGGLRNKALVDALTTARARVIRCEKVTSAGARVDFVIAEVRRAGGRITPEAASGLVLAAGSDLRELATACEQLVADTGGQVDEADVARYHRGRADASGFAVADRAVEGDVGGALELLRWALDTGLAPVLVTSSLAANLRLLAKVAAEGRAAPMRVAKVVGQPVWKVEKAQRWSRGWSPDALSRAQRIVAAADADVKGAAADARYAVERAVRLVAGSRGGRR